MNERMRVNKDGVITYSYTIDGVPDVGFKFTLFSEIGEPYKKTFRDMIIALGWEIERGRDMEAHPWCADILIRRG